MLYPHEITGVVLAGGKSQRFGSNKAFCSYNNSTFIELAIRLLASCTEEVLIAGYDPAYEKLGVRALQDSYANIGPLGGMYTAMQHAQRDWILLLTCDMPLITHEILSYMMNAWSGERAIAWVDGEERRCFPMLISKRAIGAVEQQIREKRYGMKQLLCAVDSRLLPLPTDWKPCFSNINSRQEYEDKLRV